MQNTSQLKIKFLGTAGARFAVTKQLRASGGIWFNLEGTEFLVDPGPGTLVKALNTIPKKDPASLSGILLSHRHIDHSNDLNIMVEAMTEGGRKKHGEIFLPEDALYGAEPVLLKYLHEFVDEIHCLQENSTYKISDIVFETSPQHNHGVETYGFKFKTSSGTIAHLTDTNYFDQIPEFYKSDVLIINVVCYDTKIKKPEIKHIYFPEVSKIVTEIKPKLTILTHFGISMLSSNPEKLAEDLSNKTGLKIIAAEDDCEIDLSEILL